MTTNQNYEIVTFDDNTTARFYSISHIEDMFPAWLRLPEQSALDYGMPVYTLTIKRIIHD